MYGGGGGNQFDGGASLFSGGGFMPSQATQTPESSFSKSRGGQGLLPFTVKQISEAYHSNDDKSNFAVDGIDATNVKLLGTVTNKAERVTDVSFSLDDGTGRIDVNRWVNEACESDEMAIIENGMYVAVNGSLKGFQGKKLLPSQFDLWLTSMLSHFTSLSAFMFIWRTPDQREVLLSELKYQLNMKSKDIKILLPKFQHIQRRVQRRTYSNWSLMFSRNRLALPVNTDCMLMKLSDYSAYQSTRSWRLLITTSMWVIFILQSMITTSSLL